MVYPDSEFIKHGESLITPFDPKRVQPASYDLSLYEELLVPKPVGPTGTRPVNRVVDLREDNPKKLIESVKIKDRYELIPGACVLGSTVETVHCPTNAAARVEGKSSLGRLFLAVHVTAGFIDPGFNGQVTLEIVNHGPWTVVLWTGMPIAQINFSTLLYTCDRPYGSPVLDSHYQGQRGPTAAAGERSKKR